MEWGFLPHAGTLGTKPGRRQPRSTHHLQAKVDHLRLAQHINGAFPQAADMSLPVARTAVRAVGVSSGASQWLCQASA